MAEKNEIIELISGLRYSDYITLGESWRQKLNVEHGDLVKIISINKKKKLVLKTFEVDTKGEHGEVQGVYVPYFKNIPEITNKDFENCAYIKKANL